MISRRGHNPPRQVCKRGSTDWERIRLSLPSRNTGAVQCFGPSATKMSWIYSIKSGSWFCAIPVPVPAPVKTGGRSRLRVYKNWLKTTTSTQPYGRSSFIQTHPQLPEATKTLITIKGSHTSIRACCPCMKHSVCSWVIISEENNTLYSLTSHMHEIIVVPVIKSTFKSSVRAYIDVQHIGRLGVQRWKATVVGDNSIVYDINYESKHGFFKRWCVLAKQDKSFKKHLYHKTFLWKMIQDL